MKKVLIGLALSFFLSATAYAAADVTRVGFVSSPLWFDREPFFAGQNVRVYTMLTNSGSADFSATVEFKDGENPIGSNTVTLSKNGGFQVIFIDWVPGEGDHALSASVTNATLTELGGEPQPAASSVAPASAGKLFVDTDTDGDGIGNREDPDDDNDGILDADDPEPLVIASAEEQQDLIASPKNVTETLQTIVATATPQIVDATRSVISAIDSFRTKEGSKILQQVGDIKKELETTKELAAASGEKTKTDPVSQIKLLALTTAGYTLSNTILFYVVFAIVLYFLLRRGIPWIVRKLRGKSEFE